MLIPFEFDAEKHVYTTPGRWCFATGDIISMNGLSNLDQIPLAVLMNARDHGSYIDECIQAIEEDDLVGVENGLLDREYFDEKSADDLEAYLRFKKKYSFTMIGDCQKQYAYEHEFHGVAIGCTIDLRGLIDGLPFIIDVKRRYPCSGHARKAMELCWALQTQSYAEASLLDEEFVRSINCNPLNRGIIHIHPTLYDAPTKKEATEQDMGYKFVSFGTRDDSSLWSAAVLMASTKLAAGFTVTKR